jgi:uncharacterized protein (TIGR02996 family)
MSLHAAFLKDIAANPEDDAPRLVYADWLDENGDPDRATFIRTQCRLASMGKYDLERYDLEWVDKGLLAKHGKKWLKPIAKITTNVEFRRGFPDHFSLPVAKFVAKGEELFAAAPTLRSYRPLQPKKAWGELLACPAVENVTSIDLWGLEGITVPRLTALAGSKHLRNLRGLTLAGMALGRCIDHFAASPHLAKVAGLTVNDCNLGHAGLETLLKAKFAKNLTGLNVGKNKLFAGSIEMLAKWKGASRLKTLSLSEDHSGDESASAFAEGKWSALRGASLFFPRMTTAGLNALGGCKSLSSLRSINLHHRPDQDISGFLTSPHLAGLERLMLNDRTDISFLAGSPMLANLRDLYLGAGDVASVRKVLTDPASAGLRELSLCGLSNGPAVAEAIAAAPHLTNLRGLTLRSMPLGVEGARALGEAAHLAGLIELDLYECIDAKSAVALVASPHLNRLRSLNVGGYHIMAEPAFAALQKRFGEDVVKR